MASIVDTTPISRQLIFTNFAEKYESSYHVWRISFLATLLDGVDDVDNLFEKLSEEDQAVLNWRPENLQNDVEVRDTLTHQSGRLCPYKNISTSLYDKVTSDEGSLQEKIQEHPLSAYEQISFRSAMLTKHSAGDGQGDGQPELLALHDGLGGEQSFLRWRSHDYIKVTLCKPRPFFRVFWLIQWDIVGKLLVTDSPNDAGTHQGKRPRSPSLHLDLIKPPAEAEKKFSGVRRSENRKSQWIAEMRPPGTRDKLWLGSYGSKEAAARAADVGYYYYDKPNKLNFPDWTPQLLEQSPVPRDANEKKEFVKKEARRVAELSDENPKNRSCNSSTEEFTTLQPLNNFGSGSNSSVNNMQPPTNANLDFQPSTSYGGRESGEILQATISSSPEVNEWPPIPTGSFTANSQADIYQQALSPEGNLSSLFDATDVMFLNGLHTGKIAEQDSPGDIAGYDSGHDAEPVQAEWDEDCEGSIDVSDIFNHWSMNQA